MAARHNHIGAVTFTRRAASQSSVAISSTGAEVTEATALLTRIVSEPKRRAAASTSAVASASSFRSAATKVPPTS